MREILLELRRSRMGLIQTPEQLRFSYAAIIDGAKKLPLDISVIHNPINRNNICSNFFHISKIFKINAL